MATPPQKSDFLTEEEYLDFDRLYRLKHEFEAGRLIPVLDVNHNHKIICSNLFKILSNQLQGKSCLIRQRDLRVYIPTTNAYRYPDIVVCCEEPKYADSQNDTLLNPSLLIGVPTLITSETIYVKKFDEYRDLTSIRAFLFAQVDNPHIVRYKPHINNTWNLSDTIGLNASLELPSVGCTLAMADVYEAVSFGDSDPSD